MLQLALCRHSRILIPPETHYFTLLTRSRRGQQLHWRRVVKDLKIEIPVPTERLRPGPPAREPFLQMVNAYLKRVGKSGVTHFGEKSPEHQRRVPLILATFPAAKFILIYRDGRDVALSLTKVSWLSRSLDLNFALWLHYSAIQRRLLNEISERICLVRYEDLVLDPVSHLRRIAKFLGLDYEPQMTEECGNHEGVPAYEYSYKGRAFEPITDQRIGNWRRELTPAQIARLERRGSRTLLDLGYELETGGTQRLPPWYLPALYGRGAFWFADRAIRQKLDEYCGTCLNPPNRTLRLPS